MSMYVRIKRKNQTIFLHVEPSSSFLQIKEKVSSLLRVEPNQIKLLFGSPDEEKELLDNATISDQEIKNDNIIYMIFSKENTWEKIQVDSLQSVSTSQIS
eukprot:gene19185-25031_t